MHLADLKKGDKVIYQIKLKNKEFQFHSEILQCIEEYVLASPICIKDKVIGFDGEDTVVNLIYINKDGFPMLWEGVSCITVLYNSDKLYKIKENTEGKVLNRRSTFRLNIGVKCVVYMHCGSKIVVADIKDISKTGFSFVLDEKVNDVINTGVKVQFEDIGMNIEINGMIVRMAQCEGGRFLYGCRVLKKNIEFNEYMSGKQRLIIERLQRGSL